MIKGKKLTSYDYMFSIKEGDTNKIKAVKSTNKNIKSTRYMFLNNKADKLDLNDLDVSSVEDMTGMFYFAYIDNLIIDTFNTSSAKNMESMFERSKIPKLDLSNFDTANVESMRYMFQDNKSLFINTSSFTANKNGVNIKSMFNHVKLDHLDLMSMDFTKANNIADIIHSIFNGGYLKTIKIKTNDDLQLLKKGMCSEYVRYIVEET